MSSDKIPSGAYKLPVSTSQLHIRPTRPTVIIPISNVNPTRSALSSSKSERECETDTYETLTPPPVLSVPPHRETPSVHHNIKTDDTYIEMAPIRSPGTPTWSPGTPFKSPETPIRPPGTPIRSPGTPIRSTGCLQQEKYSDIPPLPKRHPRQIVKQTSSGPHLPNLDVEEDIKQDNNPIYESVDEMKIAPVLSNKPPDTKQQSPIAHVSPQSPIAPIPTLSTASEIRKIKPFFDLNGVELEMRLLECGMKRLAKVCKRNKFDGDFFQEISNDALRKSPFHLNHTELIKFERVKQNWVPK